MKILENAENVTQAMCDEIKGEHRHLMIAMGYTGVMRCYMDLSLDEAKTRYTADGDTLEGVGITIFGFDDEFEAYEIYTKG